MRKKTAPRTRKHQAASSPQQSGLIAREKNAMQSAVTKSALDNRFHRTAFYSGIDQHKCDCFVITCDDDGVVVKTGARLQHAIPASGERRLPLPNPITFPPHDFRVQPRQVLR